MITALCATRDRAHILESALDAYTRLETPEQGWEIVIVDNGSRDDTRNVIQRFAGRLPIQYVFEPLRGKSHALNTGLEHARGELILFTDDDILPEPNWLRDYGIAAARHPEFDIFAGPVLLKWPSEPPSWAVCDEFMRGGCFTSKTPDIPAGPFDDAPIGGNFLVRATVFDGGRRFNVSVGPGEGFPMGQETEFLIRLKLAGHRTWWVDTAVTYHIVRQEQLNRAWMLRRVVRLGRGHYRQEVLARGYPALLAGLPRWAVRALATQALRMAWARVFASADRFFVARLYLNYYFGILSEGFRMRPARRGPAT